MKVPPGGLDAPVDAALARRLAELRALLDVIPVGVAIAEDPSCDRVHGNPCFERLLGLAPGEGVSASGAKREATPYRLYKAGKPLDPTDHPLQRAAATGVAAPAEELEVQLADGRRLHLIEHTAPVLDQAGRVQGAIGAFVDITARKQAEAALREAERRFRALAETVPAIVWAGTADGRLTYVSPQWAEYTGQAAAAALGDGWGPLVHPEDFATFGGYVGERLREGEPFSLEHRLRSRSGEYRWFLVRAAPVRDDEGRLLAWVGSCTDVHSWKVALEALRKNEDRLFESEDRFRLLAKATNDTLWDWDLVTNRIWWNENLATTFGYTGALAIPRLETWAEYVHPDDQSRVTASLEAALATGAGTWSAEYRFRRHDGSFAHVLDRGYLLRDDGGKPVRMVGSLMDITARKAAEAELESSRRHLARSEKLSALGALVSGVAHEIRTPLTYASNNLVLLRIALTRAAKGNPDIGALLPEILHREEAVRDGLNRINTLVRSLRQAARQEPDRVILTDLAPIVREAVDLFAATFPRRHRIEVDLAATPLVPLDREQIQAVVLNLLTNAAEAMPQGGRITVRSRVSVDGAAFEVEDTGPGIPAAIAGRVFDAFFTTKSEGTGLGLAICRRIVEAHGGTIRFTSEEGRGTIFLVTLPREGPHSGLISS